MNPHTLPIARPFIIWGVAGCGKSTIAQRLVEALGERAIMLDADDFHTQANINKMRNGVPLNSEDRQPWLDILNRRLINDLHAGFIPVLACSALRQEYRNTLARGLEPYWCHLQLGEALALKRVSQRRDHFFSAELLRTQFQQLEMSGDGLTLNATENPQRLVRRIRAFSQSDVVCTD